MFDTLETMRVDLKRHTLLLHLHQQPAGSQVARRIFAMELNHFLRIFERGGQLIELLVARCSIVQQLHRRCTADSAIEELDGFLVITTFVSRPSLVLEVVHVDLW